MISIRGYLLRCCVSMRLPSLDKDGEEHFKLIISFSIEYSDFLSIVIVGNRLNSKLPEPKHHIDHLSHRNLILFTLSDDLSIAHFKNLKDMV